MKNIIILVASATFLVLSACTEKADTEAETKEVTSDGNDYVNQLSLNDPDSINDKLHISRVNAYLRQKVFEEFANDSSLKHIDNQWNTAKLRVASRTFTNSEVKNYWFYSIIYDQIDNYGIKNTTELMKIFYENCTNPEYVSEIKELFDKNVALRKGHTIKAYKTIDGFSLDAHIFFPPDFKKGDKRPA
ncbi:MAG: hypothetical protein ACE5IR_18820, partial [bacterium]